MSNLCLVVGEVPRASLDLVVQLPEPFPMLLDGLAFVCWWVPYSRFGVAPHAFRRLCGSDGNLSEGYFSRDILLSLSQELILGFRKLELKPCVLDFDASCAFFEVFEGRVGPCRGRRRRSIVCLGITAVAATARRV